jgi:hypothetical protein
LPFVENERAFQAAVAPWAPSGRRLDALNVLREQNRNTPAVAAFRRYRLTRLADEFVFQHGAGVYFGDSSAIVDITASTIANNAPAISGAGSGPATFNILETIIAQNMNLAGDPTSNWDTTPGNNRIASLKNSLLGSTTL